MDDRLQSQPDSFLVARQRMVEEQLVRRGIKDLVVLAAMGKVPRHEFVLPADLSRAYGDHPLDIGHEQTISQPYVVASMTEELHLGPNSRVLEIGTGSGYQTAVLAEICAAVFTVERLPPLHQKAMKLLDRLGYRNVTARIGDGSRGWREQAPFDGILVTAAATRIPDELVDQLNETGRMLIPVGPPYGSQELILVEKKDGRVRETSLYGVRFVPLWPSSDDSFPPEGSSR